LNYHLVSVTSKILIPQLQNKTFNYKYYSMSCTVILGL